MPSSGGQKSALDRKSTRLNSSHGSISYAVFCLKNKYVRKLTTAFVQKTELTNVLYKLANNREKVTREDVKGDIEKIANISNSVFFFSIKGAPCVNTFFPTKPFPK